MSHNDWINFLVKDPITRSNFSVCCTLYLSPEQVKELVTLLDKDNVASDIGEYWNAPPSIHILCGVTVETADVVDALMPWWKWTYK